jgi:DNA-binding NtrC family response regulator
MNLENFVRKKQEIKPFVETAMQGFLGVKIEQVNEDISSKLIEGRLEYPVTVSIPFKQAKEQFKRHYLIRLLMLAKGNISEASRIAGIERRHFHRLLNQFKIDAEQFRNPIYVYEQDNEKYVKNVISDVLKKYDITKPKSEKVDEETAKSLSKRVDEPRLTLKEALELFEKEYFKTALKEFKSLSNTARSLKIRYETLIKKIKKLNL